MKNLQNAEKSQIYRESLAYSVNSSCFVKLFRV